MFRISNNSHDSLSMDPVHMDIGLASIRVSSHAKRSIRNILLANNIMVPGLTQSRDLLTSMDLVLKDEPQETPHATPINVVYVRVDIHEDLLHEASKNNNFIFINKLSMKKISDDVSISSQYCLIQREEIFLHDFRVHPQYIRIDIELSEDDVFDFMTSVTKKYPLTSSAPKVLALPMSWSTQHNSFSISTDRSFQKKVSLSELHELFISSPNIKKAVRAITWRNAFSLIVVIELETLPDAFPWGAWPRDAAVHTHKQAGRQSTALTGASLRSCHVTKRFRILATLQRGNKSMYSNTSGYVHMGLRLDWGKGITGQ